MSNNSDDSVYNETAVGATQLTPDPQAMLVMLNWLCGGAPEQSKFEIAHGLPEVGVRIARQFDVGDTDAAVAYAVQQNCLGQNCYVGAALRKADTPEHSRGNAKHFLTATAIRIDADTNAAEVRARAEAIAQIGMIVTTGTTPELRQQFWTRLERACDDAVLYGRVTKLYVANVGGDKGATGAPGLMRLAGSISWPTAIKIARGYVAELTTIAINSNATPVGIDLFTTLGSAEQIHTVEACDIRSDGSGRTLVNAEKSSSDGESPHRVILVSPQRLAHVLAMIPNNNCAYDEWLSTLASIHHASRGEHWGLIAGLEWSSRSSKDIPEETTRRWNSFGAYAGKMATFGSLLWRAQKSDAAKAAEEIATVSREMLRRTIPISNGDPADIYLRTACKISPEGDWPDCLRFRPGSDQALVAVATGLHGAVAYLQILDIASGSVTGSPVEGSSVRLPGRIEGPPVIATGLLSGIAIWVATGREVWVGFGPYHAAKLDGSIYCRDDAPHGHDPIRDRVNQLRVAGINAAVVSPRSVRHHDGLRFADLSPDAIRERISVAEAGGVQLDPVAASVGRHQLALAAEEFFKPVGEVDDFGLAGAPRHALRVPLGLGKTEAALRSCVMKLKRMRAGGSKAIIVFAVPEHRLSDQVAERFNAMARANGESLHAEVWRGMEAKRPHSEKPMCSNLDEVKAARAVLADVVKEVCPGCAFEPRCPFLAQRKNNADLWIVAHAMLPHEPPETISGREVAAVIIDESPLMVGVAEEVSMSLDLLDDGQLPLPAGDKTGDFGVRLAINRALLKKALSSLPEDGPLTADTLRAVGFDSGSGKFGVHAEWQRKISKGDFEDRAPNRTLPALTGAWREVERLLSDDEGSGASGRVHVGREKDGHRVLIVRDKMGIGAHWRNAPTLFLDATLRPTLLGLYWSGVEVTTDIAVREPHARIFQSLGASFGKSKLDVTRAVNDKEAASRRLNLEAIEIAIGKLMRMGGYCTAVVIGNKAVIAAMTLPPGVMKAHFNAIAGHDEFGGVDAVFVIGRPMPPPAVIEAIAGTLGGDHVQQIGGHWYPRGDVTRLIRTSNGVQSLHDEAECHPNALAEQILESIIVDQVIQAIGRGRGVNRGPDNPVDVHVWSDVPLPLPIDALVDAYDILNPSVAERQLARNGIAFGSAADVAKACPDLCSSREAPQKARRQPESVSETRGEGHLHIIDPYMQMSLTSPFGNGQGPDLVKVAFQRVGAGQRPSEAWVDPRIVPDPKATIEKLLACELAYFEVLEAEPAAPPIPKVDVIIAGLWVFAPNVSDLGRRVGVSRAQLSNARSGRRLLSNEAGGRVAAIIEARVRGALFGSFIALFRGCPALWSEHEDAARCSSTWRDLSKQEGQPPETFTGIWAETRCRWETHVALAANM